MSQLSFKDKKVLSRKLLKTFSFDSSTNFDLTFTNLKHFQDSPLMLFPFVRNSCYNEVNAKQSDNIFAQLFIDAVKNAKFIVISIKKR